MQTVQNHINIIREGTLSKHALSYKTHTRA